MKIVNRTHFLFKWLAGCLGLAILLSSSGVAFASPNVSLSPQPSALTQTLPGMWKTVPSGTTNSLLSVSFSSPTSGWAGGVKVLLRYDGTSWQVFSAPDLGADFVVLSISMVSDSDGWLVGYAKLANPYYEDVLLHWGGTQWNTVDPPTHLTLNSISAVDASNVYAAGGGTLCSPTCNDLLGYMFRWNGSTWASQDVGAHRKVSDLAMLGNNDGWMVGQEKNTATNVYQALLMRWVNGAWQRVTTPSMNSSWLDAVSVLDANHAWAVGGYASIMWNGSAWSLVPFNWTVTPQPLKGVQAVSANDVWEVGEQGTILHWDGTALAVVSSPVTSNLYSVANSSPFDVWAVGDAGIILHYRPAGLAANDPNGAPGSFFNLSATDFAPNQAAVITVNGHVLQTTTTDAQGSLAVTLTTAGLEEGTYIAHVTAGSLAATAVIHIDNGASVLPQVGSYPTLAVPAGIGFTSSVYLPAILH